MRDHKFTDATTAREFILAGNATFTLRSAKTGSRYTFRVCANKPDSQGRQSWGVKVLAGPDNVGSYLPVGFVGQDGLFRSRQLLRVVGSTTTSTGEVPEAAKGPIAAFEWLWNRSESWKAGQIPTTVEVWHAGRCGRCGRLLTVPESIASGIGPTCAEKAA